MKRWSWLLKPALLMVSLTGLVLFVYAQTPLQVGYAILTADPGSNVPVGTALFSSTNSEGVLVWEAGVAAVAPISSGRIFVDQRDGSRTALALVNPSDESVTVALILRDASGTEVDLRDEPFTPGQHRSLFVDELFSGLQDFTGSLTFQTQQNEEKVAAVTLQQNTNLEGELIFSTLPVVDLAAATSTESIIFPQVGAGEGLSTRIVLLNSSEEAISGQIQLFDSQGTAMELELDETIGSSFPYQIGPNGTFSGELTSDSGTNVGYAVVTLEEGSQSPAGSAIFQFTSGGSVISEAGIAAVAPITSARIFVDNVGTRTGVAIANAGNPDTTITLSLVNINGSSVQTTTRDLVAGGHLSIFADELFSEAGEGFTGLMEMTSPVAIAPVTLKLTTNSRNQSILTTLPLANLTEVVTADSLIFPQLGFGDFEGGSLATRLILINQEQVSGTTGSLNFFQSNGSALTVPLGFQTGSEFPYLLPAGGGRQLRPGVAASGSIAEIIIDPISLSPEIVVNEGNTIQLAPLVLDEEGNVLEEVNFSYTSLDTEVATIDAFGEIEGRQAGFSTLTVTAGEVVKSATITVVKVTPGAAGFEITGVAQDLARRLYLANSADHTILLAQNLEAIPQVYAGIENSPGLLNDERLQSLFNNPAFIALDQAHGTLYVSDGVNHVIRLVQPGVAGQVETLAGTSQAGATDGSLTEASFNNPQGVTLDNRGRLWVADSGNHTIRRINLVTGRVETIAGMAGEAGFSGGHGQEARFNSPVGLALETESVAEQLAREQRGEPPPPVSVIVADTGNGLLRRVKDNGEVQTIGSPTEGTSGNADTARFAVDPIVFNSPTGVAVDPFGNIYVTEPDLGQVKTILSTGEVVQATQGNTFSQPQGIIISASGQAIATDANRSAQRISLGTPEINAVTPESVRSQGGAVVTIQGKSFAPDSLMVVGGVVIEDFEILNTQTIRFSAPMLPSGRTTVTVQNRGGLAQAPLLVEAIPLSELSEGHITTVAGGTTFVGDGSDAKAAALNRPWGVAVDGAGNLFIADAENERVRKVDATTGIITTVAGSGEEGSSGDGGPATQARLGFPLEVAVDRAGNLFIADSVNHRIRKVDAATGIITTVAGSGEDGFSGDGGPATEASLNEPFSVAVDGVGNLFIADRNNARIRKMAAITGIITTVAGNGCDDIFFEECELGDGGAATAAGLGRPEGVAVDESGNLFIADARARIRKVDATTGIIITVAGSGEGPQDFSGDGGPATQAGLSSPNSVAVDGAGNLFIADLGNHRIRKVDGISGIITTVAGSGEMGFPGDGDAATAANFSSPRSVAVDGTGNLFISDHDNFKIRKVDSSTGIITTVAGNGEHGLLSEDGGPATEAGLSFPEGVAVDEAGNLFIVDSGNDLIRKVDTVTDIITTVAGTFRQEDFSGDGGPATQASLNFPQGVAVDGAGNLFIADSDNHRIRKVDAITGVITSVAGNGQEGFSGDGGLATQAGLNNPSRVAVDEAGNLFIADSDNHRIRKVDAITGVITSVAGNGQEGFSGDGGLATQACLNSPHGLAVDGAGNLFIADRFNDRIRKVEVTSGVITTVAGNGESPQGVSGDGSPATEARLFFPEGVAVDEAGNLFIADTRNNRIRAVRGPIP